MDQLTRSLHTSRLKRPVNLPKPLPTPPVSVYPNLGWPKNSIINSGQLNVDSVFWFKVQLYWQSWVCHSAIKIPHNKLLKLGDFYTNIYLYSYIPDEVGVPESMCSLSHKQSRKGLLFPHAWLHFLMMVFLMGVKWNLKVALIYRSCSQRWQWFFLSICFSFAFFFWKLSAWSFSLLFDLFVVFSFCVLKTSYINPLSNV